MQFDIKLARYDIKRVRLISASWLMYWDIVHRRIPCQNRNKEYLLRTEFINNPALIICSAGTCTQSSTCAFRYIFCLIWSDQESAPPLFYHQCISHDLMRVVIAGDGSADIKRSVLNIHGQYRGGYNARQFTTHPVSRSPSGGTCMIVITASTRSQYRIPSRSRSLHTHHPTSVRPPHLLNQHFSILLCSLLSLFQ